jgi:crotonobetaine/carnitine-CoA ligase
MHAGASLGSGGVDLSGTRTIGDLLDMWSTVHPHKEFLVYAEDPDPSALVTVTWGRAAEAVAQLRTDLARAGCAPGDVVLMALPNAPLAVLLWLAITSSGSVAQVVDHASGALPLRAAVSATSPSVVVAAPDNAGITRRAVAESPHRPAVLVAADLTGLGSTLLEGSPAGRPAAGGRAEADMVAGLLPTSGTSGPSKLVELTHRNFVVAGERFARNSGYTADDRTYLCSPFFHTNAQAYITMPALTMGASIAIVPRFSARGYFISAGFLGATVSNMVAPPLRMALHHLPQGTKVAHRLRLIQYGMSLSEADWAVWDELLPSVVTRQVYGQTESVSAVIGGAPWEPDDRRSLGRPLLGVDAVRLVDDNGADVQPGHQGELLVRGTRGSTLMLGYYKDPDATAAAISADGWLRTGDVMVQGTDGRFSFVGRRMHVVRRGGENVSTYELEVMLQSCPLIADVAVTAEPHELLGSAIVAHVIPGPAYTGEAFRRWCSDQVGSRVRIDDLVEHSTFPRTASGRVIARELRRR